MRQLGSLAERMDKTGIRKDWSNSLCKEFVCPEDFGNLYKLVRVVVAVEEGFLAEDLLVSRVQNQTPPYAGP